MTVRCPCGGELRDHDMLDVNGKVQVALCDWCGAVLEVVDGVALYVDESELQALDKRIQDAIAAGRAKLLN